MKVKEALDTLQYGTKYQLVGAKTGKNLFRSWVNKTAEPFVNCDVASIWASMRTNHNNVFNLPVWLEPIVVITISGL